MAFISRTTIDELNSRMDAIAIVGEYVRLEQRGGRWWGLCPFHNEKTPSFTVNPEIKSYHCFGCSKGGSVLSFVMEMDKLSFPEAVENLARSMGIEIIYENSGGEAQNKDYEAENKRKEVLFELYRRMTNTFHHFLMKSAEAEPVKRYIISRGLSELIIEKFRLGYAPADRHWMYEFLQQKGYSRDFLSHCGLFSSRNEGSPLFAKRLIFPIADRQGRVVAFGGRILDSPEQAGQTAGDFKAPKYINSPELEIYKKGETLFGIDAALAEIRKTRTVYLAEGYMDVIALHQAGINNAVAPLGTAFTDEQARLMARWAEKAVLVFDSDEAGQKATVKGIQTCRKNGLICAVVVPGGDGGSAEGETRDPPKDPSDPKDPADIIKVYGPEAAPPKDPADILKVYGQEALQKRMKCFINDFDYLLARAKSHYDIRDSGGKSKAVAFVFPFLQTLESEVSRDACIEAMAASFATTRTAIINDWRHYSTGQRETRYPKEENTQLSPGEKKAPIRMNDELFLLMTVAINDMKSDSGIIYPELRKALTIREIEDPYAKELFVALEECFANDETGLDNFLSRISSSELKKFYLERGVSKEFSINPRQIMTDGVKRVIRKRLENQLDEIVIQLKNSKKNSAGSNGLEELLADKMRIDEELRKLKEDGQ